MSPVRLCTYRASATSLNYRRWEEVITVVRGVKSRSISPYRQRYPHSHPHLHRYQGKYETSISHFEVGASSLASTGRGDVYVHRRQRFSASTSSLPLSPLTAISPVDGRYGRVTDTLRGSAVLCCTQLYSL